MNRQERIAQLVEYGFKAGCHELDEMLIHVRTHISGVRDATEEEILQAAAESIGLKDRVATPEAGYEAYLKKRRRRWLWTTVYVFWIAAVTAYVTVQLVEAWK